MKTFAKEWWLAIHKSSPCPWDLWIQELAQYTPQIYIRSSEDLLCEVGRSRCFLDKELLLEKLKRIGDTFSEKVNIICGESECAGVALVKARYAGLCKNHWPLAALDFLASPYRMEANLNKEIQKIEGDLRSLGLRRLDDFCRLSSAEVGPRWGKRGVWLWQWAQQQNSPPPPKISIEEEFEESYWVPEEMMVSSLETLYFIGRHLFQKIEMRLLERNQGVRSFQITLKGRMESHEDTGSLDFFLVLPAIDHDPSLWFLLLKEKLDQLQREQALPDPLESFHVCVQETIQWHGVQKDLFDPHRESKKQSLLESLLRIEARLGPQNIFWSQIQESYRPEKSWSRGELKDWLAKSLDEGKSLEVTSSSSSSFGWTSSYGSSSLCRAPSALSTGSGRGERTRKEGLRSVIVFPARADVLPFLSGEGADSQRSSFAWLCKKPLKVYASPQKLILNGHRFFYRQQWHSISILWRDRVCGEFWRESFERHYGILLTGGGEKFWIYKEKEELYLQGQFI